MSQKKPRRKKYDPEKLQLNHQRRDARRCRLYRWERADNSSGFFDVFGPFDQKKNNALMEKAISRAEVWLCVVTAYFLDENDDYYEEQLMTSPIGPLTIMADTQQIFDIAQELIKQAKGSGNPAHYQDTCTALYLYTPELEQLLDSDEWIKKQAAKKADLVLRQKTKQLG